MVDFRKLKALSGEVDAASSLFRHGFKILSEYRYAALDADPVFVCLSGGCEKLLKLTLGLHALDQGQQWPDKKTMQSAWRHQIMIMEKKVRGLICDGAPRSTSPGYIRQLLDELDADLYIDRVLGTLNKYAMQGRFYNLDHLADTPQLGPSPSELWEAMHHELLQRRPDLLKRLATPEPDWRATRQEMNQIIAESLKGWCELIARAWMTGVFGDQAKQWAPQLGLTR
jgi:hypothetical protein